MSKNLVIVESPTKTKAIEKYLGSDYKVVSSKGHIRDLATSGKFGFGVDLENHFEPNYVAIKGKKKDITALKKDAEKAVKSGGFDRKSPVLCDFYAKSFVDWNKLSIFAE